MVTAGRDALVLAAVCRSLRVVHHLHVASRRVYYLDWRRSGRWEGRRVIEATLPACANPRRRIDGTRVARTRHLSRPPRLANLALLGLKQPRFPSEAASRPRRLDLRPPEESHSLRRGGTRCSRHPRFGVAARTRECWWVSPARPHPECAFGWLCCQGLPANESPPEVAPGKWAPSNYRNSLPLLPHSGEREATGAR